MEHLASREGTIIRIEDNQADIQLDGQVLRWPTDQIPQPIKLGDKLIVLITTAELEKLDREALAKKILNEVLSGEESA
jgi:hypothetical protein